jgi:glycosyltransferase involved in cell wall biosynthesis
VRRDLNTPPEAVVIVQVSRLEPLKGQRAHLDVLASLTGVQNWICWLVGTPQRPDEAAYLRTLEGRARALGLRDRVRFIAGYPDVRNLVAAADIFCQPNAEPEGFGIVFVEALYAGLPVVSYAMGGAVEIVDVACGVLVPPQDTDALRAALDRLIPDPALRARLGTAGPSRARAMCDPDAGAERLALILRKKS